MATNNNTNSNNNENANKGINTNFADITATVINCGPAFGTDKKPIKNRISFTFDKTFKSLKDGIEIDTNTISMDITKATLQLLPFNAFVRACRAKANGEAINPSVIYISMIGATTSIKRTFKAKGSQREFSEETYDNDVVTSDFSAVELGQLTDIDLMFLKDIIMTEPKAIKETKGTPNPFGF